MLNEQIPEYLEYLGKKYKYDGCKGGILSYTYTPSLCDDCSGSTIIVEYRKEKRECDRFYVLFYICGINGYDYGYPQIWDLKGVTRQAKPIKK